MNIESLSAALKTVRTPFYWYDLFLFAATIKACNESSSPYGFHVHYALKANLSVGFHLKKLSLPVSVRVIGKWKKRLT